MSNTTDKLAIANVAFMSMGHKTIAALTAGASPEADKVNTILETVIKELMADDWYFNRKRVLLDDMTAVYKLTIDAAPTSAWSRGDTITGATSGVTCTVLDRLNDTVYLVTEPSGDWTDGEVLSNGTGTRDCAAGYPQDTEELDIDQYPYGFQKPSDCLFIRGVFDRYHDKVKIPHKTEQDIIYTIYDTECYFKYNKYLTADTDVADVTLTPMWFHRLISAKLAWMLSANITENQKIQAKAQIDYEDAYLEAKEKNGSEEGAIDYSGHNDWADGANRTIELNSDILL
jgi:hypothetical protein